MTIRYGLIGAGMMGQEHIRNLRLLDGAQVVAVADPSEEMCQKSAELAEGAIRTYSDYAQMVSDDICDVYIVASPNDTHHEILLDVLPKNKPVMCEKPLCTTTKNCRDVISKSANRSAPTWMAMQYRYMPPVRRLLEEAAKGSAGSAQMMAIREHRLPFLHKIGDWNRFNIRTGGTLVEKCCHYWDLMRCALKSDPVRVFASAAIDVNHLDEKYEGKIPDIIDNAYVIVEFENGTRGMLDLCMFGEGSHWQEVIALTGSKARLDACMPGPSRFTSDGKERLSQFSISDRASKEVTCEDIIIDEKIMKAGDHNGSTYFQHEKFLKILQSGTGEPEVTLEDGLWAVRVGEAAELSAQSGQSVLLADI